MLKKQTTVNFSDIFDFAEKEPFNMSWNTCNDAFFREGILTYKGSNTIYLQDEEQQIIDDNDPKYAEYKWSEDLLKAHQALVAFMKKHKLKEMLVLND
jgi:hypothetical protein